MSGFKGAEAQEAPVPIPTEVDHPVSDPSRARQKLGWWHTISFKELVTEMVQADMKTVKRDAKRRNRRE